MAEREVGTVKWFNNRRGYGFIERKGEDVFVHYRSIEGEGYKTLQQGQLVEYVLSKGEKGLQAEHVVKVEEATTTAKAESDETEPA